jgi:hypothetical protein
MSGGDSRASEAPPLEPDSAAPPPRWLIVALGVTVLARFAYHLCYFAKSPFARAAFSDGQIYEAAARDLLANPPLGSEPFYLQGIYAVFLAFPLAVSEALGASRSLLVAGVFQALVATGALAIFYRAAVARFGGLAGGLSTWVLLLLPELAFYENKFLSVSLGVSLNILALALFVRAIEKRTPGAALLAGLGAGLAVLGRPNMIAAIPFALFALGSLFGGSTAPAERWLRTRSVGAFVLGVALALAPMAARNLAVTGEATFLPSHGGAIPLFLGNHPGANGRWNTANGLVSGQVGREREELAAKLGLAASTPAELDRAIDGELTARVVTFASEEPAAWLALLGKKLWLTLGNHRFVRDYDLLGEGEMLGPWHSAGLPFGVVLGLGALGFGVLFARRGRMAGADTALLVFVVGQFVAVLAANVLVFTSAQNRIPLAVPLCFLAGPGLVALDERFVSRRREGLTVPSLASVAAALLLLAQAVVPRATPPTRPSAVHYFNLASVEELLGDGASAAEHFGKAAAQLPKQPMFALRNARALRLSGQDQAAAVELERLRKLPGTPPAIRQAAEAEARRLRVPTPGTSVQGL